MEPPAPGLWDPVKNLKTPFLIQGPALVGSSSAPRPSLLDPGRMKPATLTLAGVVVAGSTDGVHFALPVRAWLQLPSLATILAGAEPYRAQPPVVSLTRAQLQKGARKKTDAANMPTHPPKKYCMMAGARADHPGAQ